MSNHDKRKMVYIWEYLIEHFKSREVEQETLSKLSSSKMQSKKNIHCLFPHLSRNNERLLSHQMEALGVLTTAHFYPREQIPDSLVPSFHTEGTEMANSRKP